MKRIAQFTGLMALIVATLFAANATFGSGSASAGGTEVRCYPVAALFRCDVSNPQGISQVKVSQGGVLSIEQTMSGCPIRTSVGPFKAAANAGRLSVSVKLCDGSVMPGTAQVYDPATGNFYLKNTNSPMACWAAECPGDPKIYNLVDPSCYAHEGSEFLPWCDDWH